MADRLSWSSTRSVQIGFLTRTSFSLYSSQGHERGTAAQSPGVPTCEARGCGPGNRGRAGAQALDPGASEKGVLPQTGRVPSEP